MDKFIIKGGNKIIGSIKVSGAKNVALKALVAACLTDEEVVIENVPLISDFFIMVEIIKELGGEVTLVNHIAKVKIKNIKNTQIPLDIAAETRTSSMFLAPLLARMGRANIPNPGGCRIGARPIDRTIDGVKKMGAEIVYDSNDGYFHATTKGLLGIDYAFEKNTHTGTETMIMSSVLAKGKTVLRNSALEPEVDELIDLLNKMGAKIKRKEGRVIEIIGVEKLHGATFTVGPDRNEAVTLAVAGIVTEGDILVLGITKKDLSEFLEKLDECGGGYEEKDNGIRFYSKGELKAVDVETSVYPGFMTDWQSSWAILMTKAKGESIIHETVFESRFGYVKELKKMGAKIQLFNPQMNNPKDVYNFNLEDDSKENFHAAKILGPVKLHNGVVFISDLRAGATLVIAALIANGTSTIFGIEKLDRGYERLDERLNKIGANIQRVKE